MLSECLVQISFLIDINSKKNKKVGVHLNLSHKNWILNVRNEKIFVNIISVNIVLLKIGCFDSIHRKKCLVLLLKIERFFFFAYDLKAFALSQSKAYVYYNILFKWLALLNRIVEKKAWFDRLKFIWKVIIWRNIWLYYDENSDSDRRRLLSCFQNRRSIDLS